ncbi:MAG: tryptophan-rich sensory protein [Synechococcales cyanobacterium T60_A2020_003]|nr:tryptophan-rich sensory protein [Synechococcales cyanobacterium T60_A2020_003]
MLKPWMVIGGVTLLVALTANIIRPKDVNWFRRLERPRWLVIEPLIPLIWTIVLICGAWSAHAVWVSNPNQPQTWAMMGFYLLLELVIVAYTPAMFWSHRLSVGAYLGLAGCVLGVILAIWVAQVSMGPALLLLPYLLWNPIGTYATWEMSKLNPEAA